MSERDPKIDPQVGDEFANDSTGEWFRVRGRTAQTVYQVTEDSQAGRLIYRYRTIRLKTFRRLVAGLGWERVS